jgi:DNA (cytosine-5)-methyltransferase 1
MGVAITANGLTGADSTASPDRRFTFIDLFAGIGGMRLGFEGVGGKCVFTSEWDKYCRLTYRRNFSSFDDIAGDIREVDSEDIPEFDVLLAGFPCQPFSIAGVSKKNALGMPHGFEDERQGNLFFKIAEILAFHRPPAFLLENVRNLKNHDSGRTFDVILRTLESLGYSVSTRVINAKSWVPQHRERIFIAGFRGDVRVDLHSMEVPDPDSGPKMRAILHRNDELADGRYLVAKGQVHSKYTLSDHLWSYLRQYADKHRLRGNGFGYGLVDGSSVARTLSARYYKDGSEILVSRGDGKPPRRLTPRECARLMGFRRVDGSEWEIPVSDTQAYRQFGNAVVVPAVEAVARHMLPAIERSTSGRRSRGLWTAGASKGS